MCFVAAKVSLLQHTFAVVNCFTIDYGLFTFANLKGLVIVANHLLFEAFVEEAGLTQEDVQQLIDYVK